MPFEKVEFKLPEPEEEDEGVNIEIEPSSANEVGAPADDVEEDEGEGEGEDELEIEVVDDTPKVDRGRKPSDAPADVTDEELEEYSEKVRNRIKHFTKGYHDERRAKEQALRERQELERVTKQLVDENKALKGTVGKNQSTMLEQAKQSVTGEVAAAKHAYKVAYESGETDAVLEAQENLTNAKIKADRLNNIKLPSLQEDEIHVESVTDRPAPVEVDDQAKQWADENPWFGSDDEMTSFALGLHNKLVKAGTDPRSDDYYEKINSRMRAVFPEQFEGSVEPAGGDRKRTPKRQANVVAPAKRSASPRKITLTQTQVTLAKRLGLTPKQYAAQVAIELRKEHG